MTIKNIIFDLGGVILKQKSTLMEEIISQMFSLPMDKATIIWKKYKHRLLILEDNSKQFLKELKKILKDPTGLDQLWNSWKILYIKKAKVDNRVLKFISQLKKNYRVYLMSDTIDAHDEVNSRRGIYDFFDKVFVSHKEKLRKSNTQAFVNVLKKTKSQPDETILIDDLKENVKKAEELGIKGITYRNLRQLENDLVKLGVKF